jgi:hypothetical protein
MRVEYATDRVDELALVESGVVIDILEKKMKADPCVVS